MRSLLPLLLFCTPVWAGNVNGDALKRLVHQDCGSCHGLTLKGGLGPDLRMEQLAHYDRESLATVILSGVPGTPMPPWEPLMSNDEALWIAEYLLTGGSK
ncbi:c-type cytochrome [Sedimentitalea todarodis]|uniref:Cytochrome c n=1 Tax=Sedimentitalea todarodis TaxID=1631240 RepID=A0ABU3VH86_9RHOB|nr:cytochrome c [Sedimentitalea todarodis]MDU9005350.1 cytochrome c [Sedimentitalea todarodis]